MKKVVQWLLRHGKIVTCSVIISVGIFCATFNFAFFLYYISNSLFICRMRKLKSPQQPSPLFYDQTHGPQTSSIPNSLLFCSSCCWPSRRNALEETTQTSEASSLKRPEKVVVFKRESNSFRIKKSSTHSLYLSFNELNRLPSPTRLEVLSSRYSDVESVNDQPYLTARTSRSADERRYKSMPALVDEIRTEFLGNQFENMREEFMTFFREF
jgi:hypothetical protein